MELGNGRMTDGAAPCKPDPIVRIWSIFHWFSTLFGYGPFFSCTIDFYNSSNVPGIYFKVCVLTFVREDGHVEDDFLSQHVQIEVEIGENLHATMHEIIC